MIQRIENKIIGDSWDELGIDIPLSKQNSASDIKLKRCPECERLGKRHLSDPSISVIPLEGYGKCHKCGTSFLVRKEEYSKKKKDFIPPERRNLTVLKSDGLKMLTDRKITQEAINRLKIVQKGDSIAFAYTLNDELVNIKYRGIKEKKFFQSTGGMHVVYNYDNAKQYMESSGDFRIIITEGEMDVAAFESQKIHCAVSLDSGAIGANDKLVDGKFECITNSMFLFDLAEIIYIATDNDENGQRTAEELKRRFPPDKIRVINWGKYKDANEAHMYDEDLSKYMESAAEVKIEGIFTVADVEDKLDYNYKNGQAKGSTTYMPSVDEVWKWRIGEVTILTGYMNDGKTTLINFWILLKAFWDGWSAGIFSPENFPAEEYFEDVIHSYVGKTTDRDRPERMTEEEFEAGKKFVNKHFFLAYPEESVTLEEVFLRMDYLVRRKGIRVVVIDPYNQIEHLYNRGEREDQYIGRFMSYLKKFAVSRQVAIVLVAHQNKPSERTDDGNWPEPSVYNIKGGGTFADKADNVVTVFRPYRISDDKNPTVVIESQKIKKKKLVAPTGETTIYFDWKLNQYKDVKLKEVSPLKSRYAGRENNNVQGVQARLTSEPNEERAWTDSPYM